MVHTIQRLRDIAQACRLGAPLQGDLAAWLSHSLELFLTHHAASVDEALGLRGPRAESPWQRDESVRSRNASGMSDERTKRRLAAILAADVVDYSRLMHADEVATLAALKARRRCILEPLIARHGGRLFKIVGDGAMVEFGSVVSAVQCAVELQERFSAANAGASPDHQIVLRIGVHLGDVMVEGTDLYGDGVNIAARLESLAESGGVLVSEDVYRQISNKLSLGFHDIGPQKLKNIDEAVRAFRIATVGSPATFDK